MEKRVLLAAVLSGLVLLIWYSLVAPPAKRAPLPAPAAAPGESPVASPGALPSATPVAPPAEARPAARGAAAEMVRVDGQGLQATVSSAGGVISSLLVEGYTDDEKRPLDLVVGGGVPPLSFAADGPWNQEPYELARAGDGVRLTWSDGQGNWAEKTVAPGKGRFALQVEVRAGGAPARAGVVVGGQMGGGRGAAGQFASVGAVVRANGELERLAPGKLDQAQRFAGAIEYAGVEDQYFLEVLLPESGVGEAVARQGGSGLNLFATVAVIGAEGTVSGTFYAGPKEHDTLVAYGRGLDETLSFGWFGVLSVGFLAALRWIHGWAANWGVAIIVLTAALRVVLFPLTHKSTVAMRRMQKLQPKMKAIQDRYADRAKKDPNARTRMNQEIMGLYKQEGVNPMGGCLPTLVQLPILWALYTLFAYAIELRHAPFLLWIQDLSVKDPTYVLPVLMTASMFVQQKLAPQAGDPTQRRIFMMMPLIFGFMFMNFPAGLVLYWLVNNLLTIGQQLGTEAILKRSEA